MISTGELSLNSSIEEEKDTFLTVIAMTPKSTISRMFHGAKSRMVLPTPIREGTRVKVHTTGRDTKVLGRDPEIEFLEPSTPALYKRKALARKSKGFSFVEK